MKIRTGFVSNSSTSSFVCDICGREETGMDLSLSDCDMYCCNFDHTMCEEELLKVEGVELEDNYNVDSRLCPICNFQLFSERDLAKYLSHLTSIPREEAFAYVKSLNKRRRVLRDGEYVMYACLKANINRDSILGEVKEKFGRYEKFYEFINTKEIKEVK